jgi:hypothetical protein
MESAPYKNLPVVLKKKLTETQSKEKTTYYHFSSCMEVFQGNTAD